MLLVLFFLLNKKKTLHTSLKVLEQSKTKITNCPVCKDNTPIA